MAVCLVATEKALSHVPTRQAFLIDGTVRRASPCHLFLDRNVWQNSPSDTLVPGHERLLFLHSLVLPFLQGNVYSLDGDQF